MRSSALILGAAIFLGPVAPAQAYCYVFNPAICVAVCGSACCGEGLTIATPVDPGALGNFEIQMLMSEFNQAARTEPNGAAARLLKAEADRRSTPSLSLQPSLSTQPSLGTRSQ